MSDDARVSLGWDGGEDGVMTLPASDLDRVAGEDVLETFPKTDLGRDPDDGEGGDVLRVDLGTVNRRR